MTYYDAISDGYIELHRDEQLEKYRIVSGLLKIQPDDLLLDVACGPGFGTFNCRVVGLDASIKLLCQCRGQRVHAVAEALPFKDASFDIVVSITALQNYIDPDRAVQEMLRVGKKRYALTYLKRSPRASFFEDLVKKYFRVLQRIEQRHDIIFLMTKYK